jgi:uncharacterized protein
MKYLLILGIVMGLIWWFKRGRSSVNSSSATKVLPEPMVRCLHCDLHLPSPDAVHTDKGAYCSLEHRDLQEGRGTP